MKNIIIVAEGSSENKSTATNLNKLIKELSTFVRVNYIIAFCNSDDIEGIKKENIVSMHYKNNAAFRYIINQFILPYHLLKNGKLKQCDSVLFSFGEDLQLFSIIVCRLLGKRVVIRSDGRPSLGYKSNRPKSKIIKHGLKIWENFCYFLSNEVLTECQNMLGDNKFPKGSGVLKLFVDTSVLHKKRKIADRQFTIGYIGRFEPEKNIMNFINCIKFLGTDVKILIVGSGSQKMEVLEAIEIYRKNGYDIVMKDWIDSSKLCDIYNDLKILILPSKKEGLPNTMLEAMACGTIVIGSQVGGIPGVLNNSNGYLLTNNSVRSLADAINETISDECKMEQKSDLACKYILDNYSLSVVLKEVQKIVIGTI